ncbi:hypothetical protein SERLA73DRAFT_150123 [Serpula lacrymans var. lacrymans S7.3]|uniref:Uncharacterized protein n=1 Tax=Serpula lacrymans var. lacrymans (strain S7.3) TaxID=936435 RepID=F8PIU8_SERL3|nr:hypothetical protein SERLA73DRAFT_150123 [Serpula lacrymans var. lacrymans S7.3]
MRDALVQANNISEEQAVQSLVDSWVAEQQINRQPSPAPPSRNTTPIPQANNQPNLAPELEPSSIVNSKLAFNEIDSNSTIPDFTIDKLSPYAINKIKNGDYIKLWYFTVECCCDASACQQTVANSLSMISGENNLVSLKPTSAYRASKNALHNKDLSLSQIFRRRQHGEKILVAYHAQARRERHKSFKHTGVKVWDISTINENRLSHIEREYFSDLNNESFNQIQNRLSSLTQYQPHKCHECSYSDSKRAEKPYTRPYTKADKSHYRKSRDVPYNNANKDMCNNQELVTLAHTRTHYKGSEWGVVIP